LAELFPAKPAKFIWGIMNLDFWKLLAGLGLFLFGMLLVEESLRALSGKTFRKIIRHYTDGRLKSIGSGTLITAILQSSSTVSLMVLAFVGAGVMSMENAIGVIMGSNIGTTLTAWIVATLGFKLKIESVALPFIGVGGLGLIFFNQAERLSHLTRLLIGFGFLFLGLDYMKESVEIIARGFDLSRIPDYGLWLYLVIGIILTAVMQASAATIAIVLAALNSRLISFDIGAAMVIGANVGTTITVLLGSIGGTPPKKRVAVSHLLFNILTAMAAFAALPGLIRLVELFLDTEANGVMALALFHSLFNIAGVVLLFPFVGLLARMLVRMFPDRRTVLTVYLGNTPSEVTEAAGAALKKEIHHLFQECQLYNLRLLRVDEKLVFEEDLPFEKSARKKLRVDDLYEFIKLLHADIFAFYSRVMAHKLESAEAEELERVIFASRNIMNSLKNFKGIRQDLDDFDTSENRYLNAQYRQFRKRLLDLYHDLGRLPSLENQEEQYRGLLRSFVHVEETDRRFINDTMAAVAGRKIQDLEISSLLLVNRLFTQACRLQVFSLKDLLLSKVQINDFDRALDMKDILDEEKAKAKSAGKDTI
jgi:phosphate:Na+ symporter